MAEKNEECNCECLEAYRDMTRAEKHHGDKGALIQVLTPRKAGLRTATSIPEWQKTRSITRGIRRDHLYRCSGDEAVHTVVPGNSLRGLDVLARLSRHQAGDSSEDGCSLEVVRCLGARTAPVVTVNQDTYGRSKTRFLPLVKTRRNIAGLQSRRVRQPERCTRIRIERGGAQ